METDAFSVWTNIFNNNVSQSYKTERKELKIISMLLTALQFELKNVHQVLELEITDLNNRLAHKDDLKKKVSIQLNSQNKLPPEDTELSSPDIFRNESSKNENLGNSVIDISRSDEEKIENSPTLISKRKKIKKNNHKLEITKRQILGTVNDNDNSVIVECTPEVKKVSNTSKTRSRKSSWCSKKRNNTTLTQLFTDLSSKTDVISEQKSDLNLSKNPETNTKLENDPDATEMGITQLLSFINKNTPENDDNQKNIEDEMSSSHEVDEFSKGVLFDNSQEIEPSPKKKKVSPIVEPVVRGHARKLLKGFSCKQCIEFYGSMKLSPEELQRKLNECSNHRYKHQPPEDTMPGIWDMTIPEEK